jgi:hypothetical protein
MEAASVGGLFRFECRLFSTKPSGLSVQCSLRARSGKHPFGASGPTAENNKGHKTDQYQVVLSERILVLVVVIPIPERERSEIRKSAAQMVKSLSALAALMLLGASVIALPGFAPKVQADEVAVLAKGDRLELRAAVPNCSTQVWPYFAASCLRNAGSGAKIQEARLVTARR